VARRARLLLAATALAAAAAASAQESPFPSYMAPSPAVVEAAAAEYLKPAERADFRVRHGLWSDLDLDAPSRRAAVALNAWRLDDAVFAENGVDPRMAVDARLRAGRYAEVVARTEGTDDLAMLALRAHALAALGRSDEAREIASSEAVSQALVSPENADTALAAIELAALRIRLDAAQASRYPELLKALARARQQIDRLDPRIRALEARLLAERHATGDALKALSEALSLCPRDASCWRLLGDIALDRFDFTGAANASKALRRLDPVHPHAAMLDCRSALMQDDPTAAAAALAPVLALPSPPPEAIAWSAACAASRYDFAAMRGELARFDTIAPGSAEALVVAGRQLVFDRQYAEARETLGLAAAREPAWALPRAELGLLSMQDGREATAVADLRRAVELDPHDERTVFTLRLAEELAGWKRIETAHFVIRHPDGDAALVARLLAGVLDQMHREICARLRHEPAQKTIIDVMPDHRSFGVRITGLPRIHTIAVCTGPTIAIEIPKEGPQQKHLGLFDPLAVLRHEYVHTVTLSMTKNRIPHWLTEAVAVALEDTPRTFETCQMLATASRRGELFDLDGINWAFVRPEKPTDRAMAYAQGRWMVEYAEKKFGWDAMCALLFSYAEGIREDEAMRRAFGVSRDEFHKGFLAWATDEVRAWGLDPQPPLRDITMRLVEGDDALENFMKDARAKRLDAVVKAWTASIGVPGPRATPLRGSEWPELPPPPVKLDDASLRAFLAEHPQHPDLLELLVRRVRDNDTTETRDVLVRYANARPVDPLPHRAWAKLAGAAGGDGLAAGGDEQALRHLVELDLLSDKDNVYALAIARNRRAAGDAAGASMAAERAVRMNPFSATVRELAAAIAVEAERLDLAEVHVEALTALEPDRDIHKRRLERVRQMKAAK